MNGEGFYQLFGAARRGVQHAQAGIKGDAAPLGRHQLGHRLLDRSRLAQDPAITDAHLIRADDQPLIMLVGDGTGLGMGQPCHQRLCILTRLHRFIDIRRGALKGEAQLFQQGFAVTGGGGEDQGARHGNQVSRFRNGQASMVSPPCGEGKCSRHSLQHVEIGKHRYRLIHPA